MRTARIVYDADGTSNMAVTTDGHLSTQLWDSGRALIKVTEEGQVVRVIHLRRAYLIDVTRERKTP